MGGPGLPRGLYDRWRRVVTGMRGNLVGRPQQGGVAVLRSGGGGRGVCRIWSCGALQGSGLRNYGMHFLNSAKLNLTKLVMDPKRCPSKKP